MRTYENKDELKNEINKSFAKYISEFNDIPEHLKDKRIDEIDRTPAENLAYQVGWTTLVIKWESDERKGISVKTPSDNFKWNQLGELYQWFTDTYAQLSLQELKDRLNENINSIYAMIDSLSDEELLRSEPLEPRSENGKRLHYKFQFDGESKNHSCPLSYSFCIFFGSLSGNMAFIASSLPSFIAVS